MPAQQQMQLKVREQRQEWTLLALALFVILIIVTGIICQIKDFAIDAFFYPLFFFSAGFYCVLCGYNGLTNGSIVAKWTPIVISAFAKGIAFLFVKSQNENSNKALKRITGILMIVTGFSCFILAIYALNNHYFIFSNPDLYNFSQDYSALNFF